MVDECREVKNKKDTEMVSFLFLVTRTGRSPTF